MRATPGGSGVRAALGLGRRCRARACPVDGVGWETPHKSCASKKQHPCLDSGQTRKTRPIAFLGNLKKSSGSGGRKIPKITGSQAQGVSSLGQRIKHQA